MTFDGFVRFGALTLGIWTDQSIKSYNITGRAAKYFYLQYKKNNFQRYLESNKKRRNTAVTKSITERLGIRSSVVADELPGLWIFPRY
jgi:hypothetical protein